MFELNQMKFSVVLILFHIFMKCEGVLDCTVTDGSIANTEPCACGNEECTTSRGLICYSTNGGGSCRKNDVGTFGYPRPISGKCNDVDGRKSILNKATCDAAATSLGLSDVTALEISSKYGNSYPPGCFWYNSQLWYNTLTTSTSSCSSASTCLCLSAPICLETDGTTANIAPCLCGNTGCTIASGLHCYASENLCSGPPCTVTNGSVVNTESCKCGNTGCTTATGLICYSTVGGGSCRKQDVGAFGYPRPTSGKCNDVAGRKSILDKASCDAAATSLGLSDVVADEFSSAGYPPGCYWTGSSLRYNTVTTSTSSCSFFTKCLCLSAPNCLETDGSISNTGPCLCGNTGCTIASGLHCYASDNFCAVGPPCTVTDGSAANTEPCRCGNTGCTIASGLICYSTVGGGSCRKQDVGAFGYPRPISGKCNDVVGRKSIPDKAGCDAAATSLGLSDVVAREYSASTRPPGCYWYNSQLWYNSKTTSTISCSSTYSDYCLCLSVPNCLETDGTTSNEGPCLCGNTGCTIASGLHCYASDNRCSTVPPCLFVNGTAANIAPCLCGDTGCTAASGLHCYASDNYCYTLPPCAVTDGSKANTESCVCGNEDCTSSRFLHCLSDRVDCKAGKYCYKVVNSCSQYAPCTVTNGTELVGGSCACGSVDCTDGEYCHYGTDDWLTQWGLCRESSENQIC